MAELKYKVGDRVRIKSIDWFRNEGAHNMVVAYMKKYCGEVVTIKSVHKDFYRIKEDDWQYCWTDEMIKGLVEEEVGLVDNLSSRWVNEFNLPEGYIFKDENGTVINATKIVLEKKKKEYPKTYEECCRVLGVSEFEYNHTGTKVWYRHKLMATLDKLMLCRDAYWKIAGEEMGLGRPWEPNWTSFEGYPAIYMYRYQITLSVAKDEHHFLVFPTAEMRDAFKKNFDSDIEFCKELL